MNVCKRNIFACFAIFIFILLPNLVQAETGYVDECLENPEQCDEQVEETEVNPQSPLLEQEETGSLFFQIIRLIFALILVVALIYVFLYFLKRKNKLGSKFREFENVGGISVAPNKTVQLVRLGNRLYLIGVGENISLLKEIEDEELIAEILEAREAELNEMNTTNLLSTIFPKKAEAEDEGNESNQFNNLFQQELTRLKENRKNMIDKHKDDRDE